MKYKISEVRLNALQSCLQNNKSIQLSYLMALKAFVEDEEQLDTLNIYIEQANEISLSIKQAITQGYESAKIYREQVNLQVYRVPEFADLDSICK